MPLWAHISAMIIADAQVFETRTWGLIYLWEWTYYKDSNTSTEYVNLEEVGTSTR